MSAQSQPRLTPEEYLALDRVAEICSEYYDGVMYAMSGGSFPHARITANLSGWLWQMLKGKPCVVASNDLRVRATPRTYAYPDIIVVCGPEQLADDQKDVLLNPAVLVEVLSPSTEAHDRGLKFARYQTLESLQEYVLVSQTEPRVETYRRQPDHKWLYSETRGLDAICRFDSLTCEIPLSEIYDRVHFDPQS
jgi:Uma2 family endonuclease